MIYLNDLEGGFNQFKLSPESKDLTSFTWKRSCYFFNVCPFGFKPIPNHFQRIMQDLFKDFIFVQVYIDDLIIHSATKNDHINHILRVLEKLNNSNLKVNLDKCFFAFEDFRISHKFRWHKSF